MGFGTSGKDDERESSDSSSSESGRRLRESVTVKGLYGTTVFPPDTPCEECSTQATGVVVRQRKMGEKIEDFGTPLCGRHWREFRDGNVEPEGGFDWRKFVPEDEGEE